MSAETPLIESTRFGSLPADQGLQLDFPEGILGFEREKQFLLLDDPEGGPLQWLQSCQSPDLAFLVCPPALFCPDYEIALSRDEQDMLALQELTHALVLVMVTMQEEVTQSTANLKGPVVINRESQKAMQVVLRNDQWSTQEKVFA